MKSVPNKLRDIAGWIEEGREIEIQRFKDGTWDVVNIAVSGVMTLPETSYRAKPVKPHTTTLTYEGRPQITGKYIQLTPEVREALKAEGIDYDT